MLPKCTRTLFRNAKTRIELPVFCASKVLVFGEEQSVQFIERCRFKMREMRFFSVRRPFRIRYGDAMATFIVLNRVLITAGGHAFEQRIAIETQHHRPIPLFLAAVRPWAEASIIEVVCHK